VLLLLPPQPMTRMQRWRQQQQWQQQQPSQQQRRHDVAECMRRMLQ
jgi:hypothetical protein